MQIACLTCLRRCLLRIFLVATFVHVSIGHAMDDCILLDSPKDSAQSKFDIDKPGHYCLTKDLHARTELPGPEPLRAERAMIIIWTSDVVLDLQGHTLGRGRVFKNPGAVGIEIASEKFTNIRIKNGTLQDFDFGIYRYDFPTTDEVPAYDNKANTYAFPIAGIVLENITFRNNKKNFQIRMPHKAPPENPEYERRRKSQYPPCGGTDDFGRPMGKDQPCNDGK